MADEITLFVSSCTFNPSAKSGEVTYRESNSRSITGWESITLSRGIERCPSGFAIEYTEPYGEVGQILVQPGDKVVVQLGDDVVLTGFCDRMIPSFDAQRHSVRIEGRSTTQDLVDCAASWPNGQMLNVTVPTIAQNLCNAYGIQVKVGDNTDIGLPIDQINVISGETSYDLIERVCRFRALLMYDQPDGSLMISGIGAQQMASGFKEGVNVQTASVMYGMDGRFSTYKAMYMGLDTLKDVGNGGNLIATVTDPGVPRFRYHVIISENITGGEGVAQQRAQWDMARRYGRSCQVRLTTDSWRDSAGRLWEPNTFVDVDLPSLKLKPQRWIIADVTYRRSLGGGTSADVVIMHPSAFLQQPVILNPISPDITNVQ